MVCLYANRRYDVHIRNTGKPANSRKIKKTKKPTQRSRRADRLLRIGKDCAVHLKEPFKSIDHGELLYDDKGLP